MFYHEFERRDATGRKPLAKLVMAVGHYTSCSRRWPLLFSQLTLVRRFFCLPIFGSLHHHFRLMLLAFPLAGCRPAYAPHGFYFPRISLLCHNLRLPQQFHPLISQLIFSGFVAGAVLCHKAAFHPAMA